MPAKARRCPLEASDAKPHFGFVLMNGVYSRTITVTNRDPTRSVRFTVIAPKTSCLPHYHENKLRLFTRDLVKLAPGMTISIDLLLFATTMARFTDGFEVSPEVDYRHTTSGAHNQVRLVLVADKDRVWQPPRGGRGIHFDTQGLDYGQSPAAAREAPVDPPWRGMPGHHRAGPEEAQVRQRPARGDEATAREAPQDHGPRPQAGGTRHASSGRPSGPQSRTLSHGSAVFDWSFRPKRDRPIAACFPEEIEVSDLNGTVSMAPRTQLLEQVGTAEPPGRNTCCTGVVRPQAFTSVLDCLSWPTSSAGRAA